MLLVFEKVKIKFLCKKKMGTKVTNNHSCGVTLCEWISWIKFANQDNNSGAAHDCCADIEKWIPYPENNGLVFT